LACVDDSGTIYDKAFRWNGYSSGKSILWRKFEVERLLFGKALNELLLL
jgi:hypothetical protein